MIVDISWRVITSGFFENEGLFMDFVQTMSQNPKKVFAGFAFFKQSMLREIGKGRLRRSIRRRCGFKGRLSNLWKYVGVKLSGENKKMFYIPEGFAHGFFGFIR